jgi:hypothetical protein
LFDLFSDNCCTSDYSMLCCFECLRSFLSNNIFYFFKFLFTLIDKIKSK